MAKLRKALVAGVGMITILSMSMLMVPLQVGAAAQAGDLIKMDGLSSVYYLAGDGKRYVFPNEATYFSWYSDFSKVVTISQSELESYPLGKNVTVRPGTKLVKITTNPKVYAVTTNGTLIAVPDEATAKTLWGDNWAKRVIDVPDAFFTNYTIGSGTVSATAYPAGSLVKFGSEADVYYINADGTASKVATEAAFVANGFKWSDVVTATIAKPTTGADISGALGVITDTSSGAGGSANAGSGLTVALSGATAPSATIITNTTATTGNGQAQVAFTTVNFTASSDGDVKVTNLKFKRTGISSDTDLDALYLYDGATRLTDDASISSNYVTFDNASGLFTIAKGTTKSITLKGDMNYAASSGKTIGFGVNAASDVKTDGAVVSGSFPVNGNLMSVANATDLGRVTLSGYSNQPTAANTAINPADNQELFRFVLTSYNQELNVERLKLTAVGSIQTADLQNLKLYISGTQVGSAIQLTNTANGNIADFDLSGSPLVIPKGGAKTVSLRGDIKNGSTRTFYFSFQNQQDLTVKDNSYNVYVEPYAAGSWSAIKPDGNYQVSTGTLSVARSTDAPTQDVAVDATNQVLGAWDFTAAGEDIKVQNLDIYANVSTYGGILNGKVYVNDVQVGTTKNLTQTTNVNFTFGSTFIVKAGETAKVKVLGDVKTTTSTSFAGGETVQISIVAGSGNAQAVSSLTSLSIPSATTVGTASALNITAAGMTVSKYVGYGNQTVVAGTNNARLASFVVKAGAAEGVTVSSITVALSSAEYASITNLYLKDLLTGKQIGSTVVSPTASNVITAGFDLGASEGKVIDLYANVKANANVGDWIASVTADGSGRSTSASVTSNTGALQTITIGTGTLSATGGSQPDAAILLAGSADNYVAQFTFNSQNEAFTIDKLRLKVANNFATSTAAVTIKYKDKNGVEQTVANSFAESATTYSNADFNNLTLYVPKGEDATLNVYLTLTSIAAGATSGANSAIYLDGGTSYFNATGEAGTNKTKIGSTGDADLYGNTYYVRKSKPTFARQTVSGAPSSSNALYRFTVVADAAGNIEIKQLGFTVVTSGCLVNDLYLYDPNTSTQLTTTTVDPTTEGSSVRLLVGAATGATADNVLSIGTTAKTYEVRGTVSSFSSTSGDSITVQFAQDTEATTNGTSATQNSAYYNVWSDRSTAAHTTATADWTNGYLLKNMTESQSF